MRDREWRRAQRERAIARVKAWMNTTSYLGCKTLEDRHALVAEWAPKRASHPQSCSSYCCGNPRKWFKEVTLQERRADLPDEGF